MGREEPISQKVELSSTVPRCSPVPGPRTKDFNLETIALTLVRNSGNGWFGQWWTAMTTVKGRAMAMDSNGGNGKTLQQGIDDRKFPRGIHSAWGKEASNVLLHPARFREGPTACLKNSDCCKLCNPCPVESCRADWCSLALDIPNLSATQWYIHTHTHADLYICK